MQADSLRNLLQEMDNRLLRAERSIVETDGKSGPANSVGQKLSVMRAEVRRHLSKIDSIRIGDVENLERHVARLRDAAGDSLRAFGDREPISHPLRLIVQDGIGLMNIIAGLKIGLNQLGPDDVLDLVPGQKTAAFQFGFDDGDLLVVVDQPFRPNQREKDMALAALETVTDHGNYVNGELANTNVSPRLKDAFSKLQDTLLSHKNIVQVGARTQICNRLVNADAEELSASLFNLLIGHVEMVFSTLAQFEEWRIYAENAVATDLDKGSVAQLTESARALVDHLRRELAADVAVSDALETVAGWVGDQDQPDKRDVLSLARTLENIWSVIAKALLSVGRETVSAGRKMVAAAILGALLITAANMVPIIGKVPGAQWIETVYNYFTTARSPSSGK